MSASPTSQMTCSEKIMSITDETMSAVPIAHGRGPTSDDPNRRQKDLAEMMTARFHFSSMEADVRPRDFETVSVKQDRLSQSRRRLAGRCPPPHSGRCRRRRQTDCGAEPRSRRITKVGKKTVKRVVIEP